MHSSLKLSNVEILYNQTYTVHGKIVVDKMIIEVVAVTGLEIICSGN